MLLDSAQFGAKLRNLRTLKTLNKNVRNLASPCPFTSRHDQRLVHAGSCAPSHVFVNDIFRVLLASSVAEKKRVLSMSKSN